MFSRKAAKNFADILVKNGIFVEDGSRTDYGVCCMKPFVNKETFGTRVCQSAATFVRMTEQQFIAPPMDGAATVQQTTYTQPVQQPAYQTPVSSVPYEPEKPVYQAPPAQPVRQEPVQPAVQTTVHEQSVSPVNASAWQSAWNTPVSTTPVAEKKVNQIMCYTCGSMNNEGARFCSKCGTQLQVEPEAPATSPIDAWKNKW
jgi:ribosomal protein L40E